MSVSRVAQAEGVNAHQVFDWRRAYRRGELGGAAQPPCALLPVVLAAKMSNHAEEAVRSETGKKPTATSPLTPSVVAPASGAIHIELPGGAAIRVERGTDAALLRTVLESLRR
jgi:transposase-like protein